MGMSVSRNCGEQHPGTFPYGFTYYLTTVFSARIFPYDCSIEKNVPVNLEL